MTWYPIAFIPPQIVNTSGVPYSGAVLKAYRVETTTVIPMATTSEGVTIATSFALNAAGYPVSGGSVIIPHVQENYKLALYPSQSAADADSGAVWTYDNIVIAEEANSAFTEYFSGDGTTTDFVLSENLGTDENSLMVFADKKFGEYVTNGGFASDTGWTKGADWSIGGGVATAVTSSADLEQSAAMPLIEGESYTLAITITRSAGDVTPKIGGTSGTTRNSSGTYIETIIAGSTQLIEFTGNGFSGTIDAVSLHRTTAARREILRSDEFTLDGTELSFNEPPAAGTNNILVFAPSLILGAVGALADSAAVSENNAADSADEAAASAAAAEISKVAAQTAQANAEIAETNAEAAAAQAASLASAYTGTSASSVTIGTGAKSFTTQSSKFFSAGNFLKIHSAADPSKYMWGPSTTYVGTALTVDVQSTSGVGTFNDWVISLSGERGPPGDASELDAAEISYNNGTSGLTAVNVQAAIDEVVSGAASYTVNGQTEISSLQDADKFGVSDDSDSDLNKSVTWANVKTQLMTDSRASQAQAEAGTDNDTLMTPLRTAQAIAALAPGSSNISQGDINTSTGTFSSSISTGASPVPFAAGAEVTAPGGTYGFDPTVEDGTNAGSIFTFWAKGNSGSTLANKYYPVWFREPANTGSDTLGAQQRYVTASPPYDIGDGEMAGFLFLLLDKNLKFSGHYFAEDPPWAYNGPTLTVPDYEDKRTGKKYRLKAKAGNRGLAAIKSMKSGERKISHKNQNTALERFIADKYQDKLRRFGKPESLVQAVDEFFKTDLPRLEQEFIAKELEPITQEIKNADMGLIPHPFTPKADQIVVMVDPYNDKIAQMLEEFYLGGASDINKALMRGLITVDTDEILGRVSPNGVRQFPLKFK